MDREERPWGQSPQAQALGKGHTVPEVGRGGGEEGMIRALYKKWTGHNLVTDWAVGQEDMSIIVRV